MQYIDELEYDAEEAGKILINALEATWNERGMVASGRALARIETRLRASLSSISYDVLVEEYMIYQDRGVAPENIAYSGGGGDGTGRSKLIQGLLRWSRIVAPGIPNKRRLGFAFAIATLMKRVGMPVSGPYAYSSYGNKSRWSEPAFLRAERDMDKVFENSRWLDVWVDNNIINQVV